MSWWWGNANGSVVRRRSPIVLFLCLLGLYVSSGHCAYVQYRDCLENGGSNDAKQFFPTSLRAYLDTSSSTAKLDFRIWTDIVGFKICDQYNGSWPDVTVVIKVLGSQVKSQRASLEFCPPGLRYPNVRDSLRVNPSIAVSYDIGTPHRLSTMSTTIHLRSKDSVEIGCIAGEITPGLGRVASPAFRYIPLVILLLVAIASVLARIYPRLRPVDDGDEIVPRIRDVDKKQLPGIGDCLQYIQYIILSGSLSLNYPGFFQPILSQFSWAILMHAEGPVTHGFKYPSVSDGIFNVNGTCGLEGMLQVVGAPMIMDVWANVLIALTVVVFVTSLISQVGYLIPKPQRSHSRREIPNEDEQELRLSRFQYITGNILRVVYNYFSLPVITFSAFQLTRAKFLPLYNTSFAATLLALLALSFGYLLRFLGTRRLAGLMLDDRFHSNANTTYIFAVMNYCLTFVRGVAIGGIQGNGMAQIMVLAACEFVLLATILAIQPLHHILSRNTCCAIVRLLAALLSFVFLSDRGFNTTSKGYVAYTILSLHASVLVFCFFFSSLYEIVRIALANTSSVKAKFLGTEVAAERPPVYGLRQLSQRQSRNNALSQLSGWNAPDQSTSGDRKSTQPNLMPASHTARTSLGSSKSGSRYSSTINESNRYYRPPRSSLTSANVLSVVGSTTTPSSSISHSTSTTTRGSTSTAPEESSRSNASSDSNDPSYMGIRPASDYTFREADLYYRRRETEPTPPGDTTSETKSAQTAWRSFSIPKVWKRWAKREPQEQGFHVVRPARPQPPPPPDSEDPDNVL